MTLFTFAVFVFTFLFGLLLVAGVEIEDDGTGWFAVIVLTLFALSAAYIAHRIWPAL